MTFLIIVMNCFCPYNEMLMGSKTTLDLTDFHFINIFGQTTLRQMYTPPHPHPHPTPHTHTYLCNDQKRKKETTGESLSTNTTHTQIYNKNVHIRIPVTITHPVPQDWQMEGQRRATRPCPFPSLSCCLLCSGWAVSLSPANCHSGSNTKSAAETVPNRVLYRE